MTEHTTTEEYQEACAAELNLSEPIRALRLKVGEAVVVLLEDGKSVPGEAIYDPVAEELQVRVIPTRYLEDPDG